MTPEEHIIQHIRDFIRVENQDRTPYAEELADQYASLCSQTNERLRRCRELLAKGMRSEAVHEVQSNPHLLKLLEIINFPELSRWQNFCRDFDIPTAPALELDLVHQIEKAITEENDLTPLLKQYRRAMYQGDHHEAIKILRKIRVCDPANSVWQENLRPLEEEQLELLTAETERAVQRNDIKQLLELQNELEDPQRLVSPPAELLSLVKQNLQKHRQQVLHEEAECLLDRLENAFEAKDFDAATILYDRWLKLDEEASFENSQLLTRLKPIEDWYSLEKQKRDAQAAYNAALASFTEIMNQPQVTREEIERQWHALEIYNEPIPDRLRQDYQLACESIEAGKRRRQRIRFLLAACLIFLAAAFAAFAVQRLRLKQQRQVYLTQLRNHLMQKEHNDAQRILLEIKNADNSFFNSPALTQLRKKLGEELEIEQKRQAEFEAIVEQLENIRETDFDAPEAELRNILAKAQELSNLPDEQKFLEQWRLEWNLHRSKDQRKAEREIQHFVRRAQTTLQQKDRILQDLEQQKQLNDQIKKELEKAKTFLHNASPQIKTEFDDIAKKITDWEQELNANLHNQRRALSEQQQLLNKLNAGITDLDSYRELIKNYLQKFPKGSAAADLRKADEQWSLCLTAAALSDFACEQLPPPEQQVELLRQWLQEDNQLSQSVWTNDLQRLLLYHNNNETLRRKLQAFATEAKELLTLRVLYYRKKGSSEPMLPLYYRQPLRWRDEKNSEGQTHTVYWGDVYTYSADEVKPWITHTSRLFSERLSTEFYEIELQRREQDNVVPQGKFLLQVLGEARESQQLDIHILQTIDSLRENKEIPTLSRAWFIKRFLHILNDSIPPESAPELQDWINVVDRIQTNLPWMNQLHPAVIEARHSANALLERIPSPQSLIKKLQLNRNFLCLALDRKIDIAGVVVEKASRLETKLTSENSAELWILLPPAPGDVSPKFKIIKDDGPKDLQVPQSELYRGQIIFTPTDGRITKQLIQDLSRRDAELIEWPVSWPVNCRP